MELLPDSSKPGGGGELQLLGLPLGTSGDQ